MPMTKKEFTEALMVYGTIIEEWPEPLCSEGMRTRQLPGFADLISAQQFCDEVLLSNRRFEPPRHDLADRIIAAAHATRRAPRMTISAWLRDLLESLFPHPAYALAGMLAAGCILGFSLPAQTITDNNGTAYFDDEGALP